MPSPHWIDRLMLLYLRWAQKHFYPRLPQRMRVVVEEIDRRWIEERRLSGPAGALLAAAGGAIGLIFGIHAAGASWPAAVAVGLGFAIAIAAGMLSAWVQPERYTPRKLGGIALLMMLGTYAGSLGTLLQSAKAVPAGSTFLDTLLQALWRATPFQLLAGMLIVLMMWIASAARRAQLQQALRVSTLAQERDAAARQAAEARVQLLQAQIQPHFLFNTLATLQHWVDTNDERAPDLLRSLTRFLRASTETFGAGSVTLAEESGMAREYLAIMKARLGARLRYDIEVPADCAAQPLPPGLVLTLVENAVAHGIEPAVAGGEIRVVARRDDRSLELRVEDDGAGLAAGWHEGVGLANTRERLRHAAGAEAALDLLPRPGGGTLARVRIPSSVATA